MSPTFAPPSCGTTNTNFVFCSCSSKTSTSAPLLFNLCSCFAKGSTFNFLVLLRGLFDLWLRGELGLRGEALLPPPPLPSPRVVIAVADVGLSNAEDGLELLGCGDVLLFDFDVDFGRPSVPAAKKGVS